MSGQGYWGPGYDRHVSNAGGPPSTLLKMKNTYWTTKQAIIEKLGKKEDHHVVASDAELDAKLEGFRAIRESSAILLEVIQKYQNRLYAIAQEESAMGRYLKSRCGQNKTRAGRIMNAVGKSQSMAAQERLALRSPLTRLYQEVETFHYRAISDTVCTMHRMEGARTEYRGALLWMKRVSEDLDPDTYKQLEKFRKVQGQVRKTKQRFDRLKLDTMQKVDLLAASRCNMLSHALDPYLSTLLSFCQKTSSTMDAVASKFKGYQYYEFNMLKELRDTSRKLAEEFNGSVDDLSDLDDVSDDELIGVDEDLHEQTKESTDDRRDKEREEDKEKAHSKEKDGGEFGPFMTYQEDEVTMEELQEELCKAQSLMNMPLDLQHSSSSAGDKTSGVPLTSGIQQEAAAADLDPDLEDYSVLVEIFSGPSTGEDEFAQEWQAVFGAAPATLTPNTVLAERDAPSNHPQAGFMPSSLLDVQHQAYFGSLGQDGEDNDAEGVGVLAASLAQQNLSSTPQGTKTLPSSSSSPATKDQRKDMSAWFSMLADLDPLSNPDAIGCELKDVRENL